MKQIIKKQYLQLSFLLIFILLFFFLGYNKLLTTGPSSVHAWRQSDSYSFALTYFYENNKLLEPSILFVGENGHGKAISEFPILYYVTAKIWKVTGTTPMVLKFINFFILLIGFYHLALLSKKILRDNFWAMFVVLTLFSSPLLGYYSFNFIPNTPAFGLALSGMYFIYLFATTNRTQYLLLYTFIFAVASLIKVTALFSLFGSLAVLSTYYLENFKKHKYQIIKIILSFIIIIGVYLFWYNYSVEYNRTNLQGIFNQSTMPIWNLKWKKITEIAGKFNHNVFPQYFTPIATYILLIFIALVIFFRRKINKYARRATIIFSLGLISFFALFYRGINVHDYFLINTLVIIPIITISIVLSIKELFPKIYNSSYLKIVGAIMLILLLNYDMIVTRSHYNPESNLVKYNIPLPKGQRDWWDYNFHLMKLNNYQYQGIDNYLKKIGINYDSKVITLGDNTPNKTLSLMHLRGFSEYHYSWNYKGKEMIERMIELGATYLVICGQKDLNKEYLVPFTKNLYGRYNNVYIYELDKNLKDNRN